MRPPKNVCQKKYFSDCFSKKAWVIPLKDKTSKSTYHAMKKFFKVNRVQKIEVDGGGEFYSKKTLELFHEYGIQYFSVYSDTKNAIIERYAILYS